MLKRTIDFNLLGEESESETDRGDMDLDDDLSVEISPSPPPLKLSRINLSSSSDFSTPPCRTPFSRLGQFSPSPTQDSARVSRLFPKPIKKSFPKLQPETSSKKSRKSVSSVNTNPFTPLADNQNVSRKRQFSRYSSTPALKDNKKLHTSFDSDSEDETSGASPVKKIRVSDFSVSYSRFEEEFVEISELASGEYGCVKRARHRLDGVDYAVKISKKNLKLSRHDERMALNEVFAHAALIKHKHLVRYYTSWVENGDVYIQNELCRGGSLGDKLEEMRKTGLRFSEAELRRLTVQILKGLHYIHAKDLVHLDIKPDNILLASEPGDEVDYKIGDLGHVFHLLSESGTPEEGDCRYMAPELMTVAQMKVDRQLIKADIFSLGLSIYEAASLVQLPRNSEEDPVYERLKQGKLPQLSEYSSQFNSLLEAMVSPSLSSRPDTAQLLGEAQPRCSLLQEWLVIKDEQETYTENDTSDDTSLEEDTDTENFGDKSQLELVKAQQKIFDLEKELKTIKDVQASMLNDSLSVVDSMKESDIGNDEKVEKYEALLKKVQLELQTIK